LTTNSAEAKKTREAADLSSTVSPRVPCLDRRSNHRPAELLPPEPSSFPAGQGQPEGGAQFLRCEYAPGRVRVVAAGMGGLAPGCLLVGVGQAAGFEVIGNLARRTEMRAWVAVLPRAQLIAWL